MNLTERRKSGKIDILLLSINIKRKGDVVSGRK